MKDKLSIIILNWNGTDDTIECIDSLLMSNYKNFNLIVVDNASDINNFNKLQDWCQRKFTTVHIISNEEANFTIKENLSFSNNVITFLRNDQNYGFAIANNIGAKFALLNGAEEILLLNNDTITTPTFLDHLLEFSKNNPGYVALTPKIYLAEPRDIIWNCGGKVTWFGNRRYYFAGQNTALVPSISFSEITFITGCALYFKPGLTGLLSEQFFFGEEDFEFSLRLLKKKQKMACIYDSVIYHKVGQSLKSTSTVKLNSLFLHYVNRLIDHKSYYPSIYRWVIKIMNLSYGFYLTFYRNKFGLRNSIKFWIGVNRYVKHHNEISKNDFDFIMQQTF